MVIVSVDKSQSPWKKQGKENQPTNHSSSIDGHSFSLRALRTCYFAVRCQGFLICSLPSSVSDTSSGVCVSKSFFRAEPFICALSASGLIFLISYPRGWHAQAVQAWTFSNAGLDLFCFAESCLSGIWSLITV